MSCCAHATFAVLVACRVLVLVVCAFCDAGLTGMMLRTLGGYI